MHVRNALASSVVAACVAASVAHAQTPAVVATWGDLESWTRAVVASETESGLGLHLAGGGGTALVAFAGRVGADPTAGPPGDVEIQVAIAPRANPNAIRTATLIFVVDADGDHRVVLDLSAALRVDGPAPGAAVTSGIARLPSGDFVRMATAGTLRATVLGFDVEFRRDQIDALRTLAGQLRLRLA